MMQAIFYRKIYWTKNGRYSVFC